MTHHNADELAGRLETSADAIMLVDGDRDHMNASDLTCNDTQIAARLLCEAASALRSHPQQPRGGVVSEAPADMTTEQKEFCVRTAQWLDRIKTFPGGASFIADLFRQICSISGLTVVDQHDPNVGIRREVTQELYDMVWAARELRKKGFTLETAKIIGLEEQYRMHGSRALVRWLDIASDCALHNAGLEGFSRANDALAALPSPVAQSELSNEEKLYIHLLRQAVDGFASPEIVRQRASRVLPIIDRLTASQSPEIESGHRSPQSK